MSSFLLQINADTHTEKLVTQESLDEVFIAKAQTFFHAVAGGVIPSEIELIAASTDLVRATGTVTVASIQANDTITINGKTLTGKASPVGADEFDSDGTDTVVASAIAACINANPDLEGIVYATSQAAVVTIHAQSKGKIGNAVTLASSNSGRLAVSAARLAGGTGATSERLEFNFGK